MRLRQPYELSIAARYLRDERRGHTLTPTGVVHEAYLRLAGAAFDQALQATCAVRELVLGGVAQEGIEATLLLDGTQRLHRQAQADRTAERVAQQRGLLQVGQEPASEGGLRSGSRRRWRHPSRRDLRGAPRSSSRSRFNLS